MSLPFYICHQVPGPTWCCHLKFAFVLQKVESFDCNSCWWTLNSFLTTGNQINKCIQNCYILKLGILVYSLLQKELVCFSSFTSLSNTVLKHLKHHWGASRLLHSFRMWFYSVNAWMSVSLCTVEGIKSGKTGACSWCWTLQQRHKFWPWSQQIWIPAC